jgi:methyl-accepting chemotaxis protein
MQQAVDCVGRSVHLTQEAKVSVLSINQGATQLCHLVKDISHALSEQSLASQEIARNVEQITMMISHSQQNAKVNQQEADVLETSANDLLGAVSVFKT